MTANEVEVLEIPDCDVCRFGTVSFKKTPAAFDGKTKNGPWAYMCEPHFGLVGIGLGLGRGQRLVLAPQS